MRLPFLPLGRVSQTMLTPKPQLNLRNAKGYFREHLAAGDYYTQGHVIGGEWRGAGASMLGLEGAVTEDAFLKLCDGLNPQTGKFLTARRNTNRHEGNSTVSNRRVFYDFTIAPPKSVSIVALYQDARILAVHDAAGVVQGVFDLLLQFFLEVVKFRVDLFGRAAGIVDLRDALFKIDARLDGSQNFVAGSKNTVEELEFFEKELIDALIGSVGFVKEINDNDIVFLAVTVATSDALLDTLRIPREIVVDDQRAELQVHSFRGGLRGNHDGGFVAEVIHNRSAFVGGGRVGDPLGVRDAGVSRITDGRKNFSLNSCAHCLRKLAGTITSNRRFCSAHFCANKIPASIVLPRPTSSAKIAPLENGDLKAKSAASTWCGFRSTRASESEAANLSILPDGQRFISSSA